MEENISHWRVCSRIINAMMAARRTYLSSLSNSRYMQNAIGMSSRNLPATMDCNFKSNYPPWEVNYPRLKAWASWRINRM